jgi:polar amino acid transport system substrate-binding protein
MIKALAWFACVTALGCAAPAAAAAPDVMADLAPGGTLKAAINFGNPVLAQRDPAGGEPHGVSADLARELGRRLGVAVKFVTFDAAGKVFDALASGAWDIAFLAIEPERSAEIAFSAPYVLIEGTYMVTAESPLRHVEDVDRDGIRVAVGNKSAYDLFLTRNLKHASLVREPTSPAAVERFMKDGLECVAGVRQPLVQFAAAHPGLRVMEDRFMAIAQAVGTPRGRQAGAAYLRSFVEEMKASGFVAHSLQASGQSSATVAPPSLQQ